MDLRTSHSNQLDAETTTDPSPDDPLSADVLAALLPELAESRTAIARLTGVLTEQAGRLLDPIGAQAALLAITALTNTLQAARLHTMTVTPPSLNSLFLSSSGAVLDEEPSEPCAARADR